MKIMEDVIEYNSIKEKWAEFAMTDFAKEKIKNIKPCETKKEMVEQLKETTEVRSVIEKSGKPPLAFLLGIHEILIKAEEGGYLNSEQLEEMARVLEIVGRVKTYLNNIEDDTVVLSTYAEKLNSLRSVQNQINMMIFKGKIQDDASKILKKARKDVINLTNDMREKATKFLNANRNRMTDSFCTIKDGHVCVPVKANQKQRIQGSIIDKSATGGTLFIEPISVSKLYNEKIAAEIEVYNEELRILYELTLLILDNSLTIEKNLAVLEDLDFIFSKGYLSMDMNGVEPSISKERYIFMENAKHPLLDKEKCVPLQFELGKNTRGIVITGPNTGGKTVCIKTVMLLSMMAQTGLHIPCTKAVVSWNSNYFCDIGDGQNMQESFSTFSAHITNVLDILDKVDENSLVIMDELGSGTDPTEGMGIAISIIEKLKDSGVLFLVTTHYPEVKLYADKFKEINNARMTFDKLSLSPTYQLVIGEAGESCAFYIAERLGMSKDMLATAEKAAYQQLI